MMLVRCFILILVGVILASCTAYNRISPEQLPLLQITSIEVVAAPQSNLPSGTKNLIADQARQAANAYRGSLAPNAPRQRMVITVKTVRISGFGTKLVNKLVWGNNTTMGNSLIRGRVDIYDGNGTVRSAELIHVNVDNTEELSGSLGQRFKQFHGKQYKLNRLARGLAMKALNYAYGQKNTPGFVRQAMGGSDMVPYVQVRNPTDSKVVNTQSSPNRSRPPSVLIGH